MPVRAGRTNISPGHDDARELNTLECASGYRSSASLDGPFKRMRDA